MPVILHSFRLWPDRPARPERADRDRRAATIAQGRKTGSLKPELGSVEEAS